MKEITAQIQGIAARLLDSRQVDMVLAWEKGAAAHQSKPFWVRSSQDVDRIVFDEYAIHNLSNYLLKYRHGSEKVALVVKGCDSRGVVRLLEDKQFQRERVYLIGVCCPGMKDPLQGAQASSGLAVTDAVEELAAKCQVCMQPNPVIYDELIGTEQVGRGNQVDRFTQVKAIEQMPLDERYQFFSDAFSRCIRCYACRQVCVACNCTTCIFDDTRPQWVGRETSTSDNFMYHLIKATHMAGRCVECGECERVCPVNIPLMLLNQKLIKDVDELYGPYQAGMNQDDTPPPLSRFDTKDHDNFL